MLRITLPKAEFYDESTSRFVDLEPLELRLEHSLVSLSKWEAEYEKPFLTQEKRTSTETLSYIHAMCLDDIPFEELTRLTQDQLNEIGDYINSKRTATWFNDGPEKKGSPARGSTITSELIYHWMINFQIPFECQHWHLNRLLTLIKVCNIKQQGPKKMSRREMMARNKALNEQRKAQYNTRG